MPFGRGEQQPGACYVAQFPHFGLSGKMRSLGDAAFATQQIQREQKRGAVNNGASLEG
jgi:hypothetical protein